MYLYFYVHQMSGAFMKHQEVEKGEEMMQLLLEEYKNYKRNYSKNILFDSTLQDLSIYILQFLVC